MQVTVAAVQMSCSDREDENLTKAERLVRNAVNRGANVILMQEQFSTQFFGMQGWDADRFALASTAEESAAVRQLSRLAAELGVVVPASFFERSGQVYFEVAPLWWTPENCAEGVSRCRRNNRRMRRSTGARRWSWFARAARPVELAREFEWSASAIRNWVRQADRDQAVDRRTHRNWKGATTSSFVRFASKRCPRG